MPSKNTRHRTYNIRVTSKNETQQGEVKYSKEDIGNILDEWCNEKDLAYWFAEHEADEDVTQTHYHIVVCFKSAVVFDVIKEKFPYGLIEPTKSKKLSIQYLIHMNHPDKHQYVWDDVVTNCSPDEMERYKNKSENDKISFYINSIGNGEIQEFEAYEKIPIDIYSRYRVRIKNAFEHQRLANTQNVRDLKVIFITGDTGSGKTYMARQIADRLNYSYCISSSSNDPFQDYKGEDCIILDDIRDNSFSFTDFLKVIDPYNNSSVKSRYYNKQFIGDMIIITSYMPLENWYQGVEENRGQLYRRISCYYKIAKNVINCYEYNGNEFLFSHSIKNEFNSPKEEKFNSAGFSSKLGFLLVENSAEKQEHFTMDFMPCEEPWK